MNRFAQILSVASLIASATISALHLPSLNANSPVYTDASKTASSTSRMSVDGNNGSFTMMTLNATSVVTSTNINGNIASFATLSSVNATTTGIASQGPLASTYDAGSIPLFTSFFTTSPTTTLQGGYVQSGNFPIFSWGCLPDGVTNNSCVTTSSRLSISAPIMYSAGATTTITTSTLLGIDASRYMVISGNATTGTTPQQLFATTTAYTVGGTTIRLTGVSSTQPIIISGATTVDVNTTLPFGGVAKTCYIKAGMTLEFMWYKNQQKWMPVNPSPYICF